MLFGENLQGNLISGNAQRKNQTQTSSPNIQHSGEARGELKFQKCSVAITTEENITSLLLGQAIMQCSWKPKPFWELEMMEQQMKDNFFITRKC